MEFQSEYGVKWNTVEFQGWDCADVISISLLAKLNINYLVELVVYMWFDTKSDQNNKYNEYNIKNYGLIRKETHFDVLA